MGRRQENQNRRFCISISEQLCKVANTICRVLFRANALNYCSESLQPERKKTAGKNRKLSSRLAKGDRVLRTNHMTKT